MAKTFLIHDPCTNLNYNMLEAQKLLLWQAVFWIRIRIGSGFNQVLGSGYGSGFRIRIRIQGQESEEEVRTICLIVDFRNNHYGKMRFFPVLDRFFYQK